MRDLRADLEICNKATPGPWIRSKFGLNILTHDSEISTATQKYSGTSLYAEEQIKKLEANANFIAAAREGWPEAIERAIKAEEELQKAFEMIMLMNAEGCDEHQQAAALREENELQRQAIQDLSQRVVRLRAGLERIKTTIEEYHPHDTLTLPKFSFAKELHDIALAELEVQP